MNSYKFSIYIILLFLVTSKLFGQGQINNFDVSHKYSNEYDTIFYMLEMSNYLDTTFLNRYEDEIIKFEENDINIGIKEGQILFLGSSSIKHWDSLTEDLFPIPAINRGFGGSTLPEAIYYFNRLAIPYNPATIVLYEGDNDIMAPFLSPEVILKMFKIFVRMTERYLPETDIYFLSIKPSPSRIDYIDKMLITNMLIEEYCKEKTKLNYIDITDSMYDLNGEIKLDIFQKDEIHMNEKGYELWKEIVKDALLK